MNEKLVAHEQSITKIFGDDYVFRIPGYQRPYAWTTEQARELYDDLTGFMQTDGGPVDKMAPYFLGSIVLIKSEGNPASDVVDGQQRITTLTILLAAIRSCVSKELAGDITPLIYEKGNAIRGTTDRYRLTLRDRDQDFFQNYIQREGGVDKLVQLNEKLADSQANIRANALMFRERLEKLDEKDRARLALFIATRCYLVVVATPDLDSAYRIFSVLNSRGLDLSATDILKAEIIGKIAESQRNSYTKKWEDLEEDLGRDAFGVLFSQIRMIYRKSKPKGTLLKEFKDHVKEIEDPIKFIDTILTPAARDYEEIVDCSYASSLHAEKVNEYLRWLKRIEFTDWVPPTLAFMARYRQQPELMKNYFGDLERLTYGMLVTKKGINERIDRFSKLTAYIEDGRDLWNEQSPLQLSPYEQNDVYSMLDGAFYDDLTARARTAILLRLDSLLSGGGAVYDYDIVSIEHVLPQNPGIKSKWMSWFPDQSHRRNWVHKIGNLALLSRRKNSAASNYDFDRKKSEYFTRGGISPFPLTTQVLRCSEWTPDVVQKRQLELLSVLENHWRLKNRKTELDDL